MTNAERQKSLDKKKYVESENRNMDRSGYMDYCHYCNYRNQIDIEKYECLAPQAAREANHLCAKAFNKKVRKSK